MDHTPITISDSGDGPRTVCAADGLSWPCPDAQGDPSPEPAPTASDGAGEGL